MAIPILNHMDFGKAAEIQNVLLHTTGEGDVTGPGTGQIIYDSGTVKFYNGSAWVSLASGGSALTQEQVEDFAGALVATGGTKTGITVTYDDANGNMDFVIGAGDIVHSMLGADAVDGDNIGDDVINSEHIAAGAVDTEHIADAQITMAKLANIATDTFIGRTAASAGVPKALSKAEALAILNVADGAQVNVSGDSGNAAIYDNSGTPAFKSGITKAEVQTLLNIEDGATADQTAAEIRTLVGTGNGNFVPSAGSSGTFLAHDGVYRTPSYVSNTDIDVNIANLTARLPQITESVTIGDATDVVVTTSGNLVVTGDLTVSGDTVTANVGTLDVEDKNITLNKSASDSSATADGAGLTIQDAVDASNDASILWNAAGDKFVFSHPVDVTGILTATGTSVFANLDISGDVDVDGTLEADAITLNGTALGALATLDTVAAGQIDSNAVTTAKINADAVTSAKIADDAIDSEHITDGSVDNAHLAGSIANAKLANSSITINGSAISLGGSVTTSNTQLAIASVDEVQTGSNNTKAITPLRLAQAKNIVQVIDVSSLHATQLNAVIQHDLGTKALQVTAQYKGAASNYQQVILDWSTNSDTSGTDSDNHILVQFAAVPEYDITVQIHSKENAGTATGITYPTS